MCYTVKSHRRPEACYNYTFFKINDVIYIYISTVINTFLNLFSLCIPINLKQTTVGLF